MIPDPQHAASSGVEPVPVAAAFAALLEQGLVGLGIVDRDLRYVVVNEALAAMNDLPAAAHTGRHVADVLAADAGRVEALLRRVLAGETLGGLELAPASGPAGRRFRATYAPLRESGEVIGVLALVVDVTISSRIEHALRMTEERLHLALEGTRTGTYEWDITADRVRWSENVAPMYGRPRGWAPADYDEWLATVHPDDRATIADRVREALDSSDMIYVAEFRGLRADGVTRWMSTRGHVVRDDAGRPVALVGLITDVHARRIEQQAAEFLGAVSDALSEAPEVEAALDGLGDLARAHGMARGCTVHLAEADGRLPTASDGLGDVVAQRRAVLWNDSVVVPIVARGEMLGAITFEMADGAEFDDRAVAMMTELGRRIGLAVMESRLQRAQQTTTRRLLQLQTVTDVALNRLGLDELLYELLRRVRDLLAADLAVCLLLDPDEHALRERAALGFGGEPRRNLRVPLGEGIAGRIAVQDDAVMIDDVPGAHPVSERLAHEASSLLGVPLQVDGRTLGVLHVASREPRRFTRDEADLLMLVGDRVARALAQAAAYETAQATALTLQRSLLPARVPEIAGYGIAERYLPGQAGLEIGGDWYDVIEVPDGRYAICVGDVVGRGVTAASIMARARSSLRALLRVTGDAARAIELLDELIVASEEDPFVTLVLALLEPSTGRLEMCSAGHPAPVLVSGGRGHLLDLPVGPPIGGAAAVSGIRREVAMTQLPVGGVLLLYTDGLVERRGEALEERFAALRRAVAGAPADAEGMLEHVVTAMLGDRTAADDVALIGVLRHR